MDELKEAVVKAALRWAKGRHPRERETIALLDAIERLEENICPETAIGGDPAWPHRFRCDKTRGHAEATHHDPNLGDWTKRR